MIENRIRQTVSSSGEVAVIGIGDFGSEALMKLNFRQDLQPLKILINWSDSLPPICNDFVHVALDQSQRGFHQG